MDYFSKLLRNQVSASPKTAVDHLQEFSAAWNSVKNTLIAPDERQLSKGIGATDVPQCLQSMVNALVDETSETEDGDTGACLEYLLKNDVLGTLVRLSENDRPLGIQAEVLRAVSKMVVSLDEQFLVHSVVHKAVLRLLRNCVGDDIQEQLDGKRKLMGAARSVVRAQPSAHEEDLVHLLCILCTRIRTYRELLMIFFHDKHWYRSEPLFMVEEEDEDEDEDEDTSDEEESFEVDPDATITMSGSLVETEQMSPTSSHQTITSHRVDNQGSKKTEYEFLLFNYLLRFVHREGVIGAYARAGLSILMDVAMSPGEPGNQSSAPDKTTAIDSVNDAALALAEYIVDGDFSEVLGAGLSAVYSLLPSKLGFFMPTAPSGTDIGMKIGGVHLASEHEKEKVLDSLEKKRSTGMEDARSPEFQAKMDHFLTLLLFLQDVLRRNVAHDHDTVDASFLVSSAIVQSILDAVRRVFLENVLYPSILECSDLDGSAVAVMSYIDIIIRTLREGPLATLFIEFLMSEDNSDSKQRGLGTMTLGDSISDASDSERLKKSRRRQSSAMLLLEMEAPESRKPSDYFTSMGRFTLKDLLISNMKSKNQETSTSALQLLHTLLNCHPQLSTERILSVIPDSSATAFPYPMNPYSGKLPKTEEDDSMSRHPELDERTSQACMTYSTHEREMDLYLSLVSHFDPLHSESDDLDNFSTGYDHYLRDALFDIQSRPIYLNAIGGAKDNVPQLKHRLNVNDPVLSIILDGLSTFFSNSPDFNIALTGIISTLATNPERSVAGWITFSVNEDQTPSASPYASNYSGDDGDDRSIDYIIEEKLATDTNFLPAVGMDDTSKPVVYAMFQALVNQLDRYRHSIANFDKFSTERRKGLLFSENLIEALGLGLDLTDEPRSVKVVPPTVPSLNPVPESKPKPSATSSFVSFLTPKKSRPAKPSPEPVTPSRKEAPLEVSTSPFGAHYQQTVAVKVEPFVATLPSKSPWRSSQSDDWSLPEGEDDVFGSAWGGDNPSRKQETSEDDSRKPPVTLSQLLDNVVILEESIKEVVAIIHARRSLGIDSLRFL